MSEKKPIYLPKDNQIARNYREIDRSDCNVCKYHIFTYHGHVCKVLPNNVFLVDRGMVCDKFKEDV